MIRPGEIYMADFAEAGPHPVIVLSREELSRGRYALVVVCMSSRFSVRSRLPNCVPFRAGNSASQLIVWLNVKTCCPSI